MARNDKLAPGIQVFRGSRPQQDVYTASLGNSVGCCPGQAPDYDKLAGRTRFDNSLAHSNPTGANDKFVAPFGVGWANIKNDIVNFINKEGVGAHISVLAIPTYAFVTGVGIHIEAEEPGLTFNLVTRNGLVLPSAVVNVVEAEVTGDCELQRTLTVGSAADFQGFGALGNNNFIDIFGRDSQGEFSLEADEIALQVASMPASGDITGEFKITVSVSYDVIHRAES